MKKMVISLAVALVCVSSAFADNEMITSAAINPETIPQVVKSLNNGVSLADFASDVMDAIGKMPLPPKEKSAKLLATAEGFFKIAGGDGKEMDKIITVLVSNVPSTNLAKWTRQFRKSTTADFVNSLPQAVWEELVGKVCNNINKLSNTSDDDKVVITSFALILLARDEDLDNPGDVIARVAGYLPESYKDQVLAALPDALNNDFSSLLLADVLDNPGNSEGDNTEGGEDEGDADGGNTEGAGSEGSVDGGNTEGAGSEGSVDGGNTEGAGSEGGVDGGNTEGAGSEGSVDGGENEGDGSEGSADGGENEGDADGGSEGGNVIDGGDGSSQVVSPDFSVENPGDGFVNGREQILDGPNGERGGDGNVPNGQIVRPAPQPPKRPFVPPVEPVRPHKPIIPVPYPNQF